MDSILASYRTCCEMSISLIVSIRHIRGQRIPYIASISEFRLFECHFGILFTSRNWFAMQGPVAIILISWNVIFIWEKGYWTRAIKRFALFDLLKSLCSDTKFLSKYIPSLQKRLQTMDFHIVKMHKDKVSTKMSKIFFFYQCVT